VETKITASKNKGFKFNLIESMTNIGKFSVGNQMSLLGGGKSLLFNSGSVKYKRFSYGWRYPGCKEVYDSTFSRDLMSGQGKNMFLNFICSNSSRNIEHVTINIRVRVQFYAKSYLPKIKDFNNFLRFDNITYKLKEKISYELYSSSVGVGIINREMEICDQPFAESITDKASSDAMKKDELRISKDIYEDIDSDNDSSMEEVKSQ